MVDPTLPGFSAKCVGSIELEFVVSTNYKYIVYQW